VDGQLPGREQLNFVFEPSGGSRIYMAGSYPDPSLLEVAATARAEVTLLQVMANNTLRGLEEQTARFAMASGCRIVVPQHHDPLLEGFVQTDVTLLKKILKERSDIVFMELVPGQWYDFD
jgi:L-ascorbate metabolism protein UlaG (beta-lactamase superfamily)